MRLWAETRPDWASFVKNWGGSQAGQFHFGLIASGGQENIFIKQADGKTPNVSEPDQFPLDSWHHVAFVCDGSKVRLYRDGAEVASTVYNGTFVVPPMKAMGIGAKLSNDGTEADTGAAGYWRGKMDEVAIWTRGLSPNEILAIYTAGLNGKGVLEAEVIAEVEGVKLSAVISGSNLTNHFLANPSCRIQPGKHRPPASDKLDTSCRDTKQQRFDSYRRRQQILPTKKVRRRF